jgi:hypothetical protein
MCLLTCGQAWSSKFCHVRSSDAWMTLHWPAFQAFVLYSWVVANRSLSLLAHHFVQPHPLRSVAVNLYARPSNFEQWLRYATAMT